MPTWHIGRGDSTGADFVSTPVHFKILISQSYLKEIIIRDYNTVYLTQVIFVSLKTR